MSNTTKHTNTRSFKLASGVDEADTWGRFLGYEYLLLRRLTYNRHGVDGGSLLGTRCASLCPAGTPLADRRIVSIAE